MHIVLSHEPRQRRPWLIFDVRQEKTMTRVEVGFITAAAVFAAGTAEDQQRGSMRRFVSTDDEGSFAAEYVARFVSEFDFALQRLLRNRQPMIKSLRAEDGYAWPEYHKGWLRFGCNLMVEDHELAQAIDILSDPHFAGSYDALLEAAASDFVASHFSAEVFEEVSVTFYVAAQPGTA